MKTTSPQKTSGFDTASTDHELAWLSALAGWLTVAGLLVVILAQHTTAVDVDAEHARATFALETQRDKIRAALTTCTASLIAAQLASATVPGLVTAPVPVPARVPARITPCPTPAFRVGPCVGQP